MAIRNTADNYGTVAKWLHWGTALLFLLSYVTVYYRHWFTEEQTPENWTALQLHLSVGVTIGVLVLLRILWRVMNPAPRPEPGSRLAQLAAHAGHYALYAIMILAPLTGYLGTSVDTEYFFLFDIPKFESTQVFALLVTGGFGISFEQFERPLDFVHKQLLGEWLIWMLVTGHALAALYHHWGRRDRTLYKMTNGKI
ncbi:cytochrome b [Microbulbifer taiwanensis]|uniref:Cytochrome b n=1 Tax=Microbulbifer taiwanensis TaxID=986746 RepID=A0ABW1YNH5_9GAMM|nr:cytochrome b [Microbulbifer taiwanensis]